MEEFRRMKNELLPSDELERAKDLLKGNILLGLESSTSRMSNLARQEMYFEYFFSMKEVLDMVENVTAEQVQNMAQSLFKPESVAVTLLGRLDGLKVNRKLLACSDTNPESSLLPALANRIRAASGISTRR